MGKGSFLSGLCSCISHKTANLQTISIHKKCDIVRPEWLFYLVLDYKGYYLFYVLYVCRESSLHFPSFQCFIFFLQQSVQKMREQISQCLEQQSAPPTQTDLSEEDRERMNRRLQRILHRKKLYLERERILQKLKRDLK